MLVAFSISPTATTEDGSVSEAVAAAVRVVKESGLPMGLTQHVHHRRGGVGRGDGRGQARRRRRRRGRRRGSAWCSRPTSGPASTTSSPRRWTGSTRCSRAETPLDRVRPRWETPEEDELILLPAALRRAQPALPGGAPRDRRRHQPRLRHHLARRARAALGLRSSATGQAVARSRVDSETRQYRTGDREVVLDLTRDCAAFVADAGRRAAAPVRAARHGRASRSSRPEPAATTTCSARSATCCRPTTAGGTGTARRGHGRSHVMPAIVPPYATVPVLGGRLALGTWQSICLVDLNVDNDERTVRFSFLAG